VWTYGHRNPQGIAFQPGTGAVFEVEHGPDDNDEINVLEKGGNYGWPAASGPDPLHRFKDPVWSSGSPTIANSGATFVTGAQWGTWSGSLFTCQLKEADLRRYAVEGTRVTPAETMLDLKYGRLRACVQGPDGALYLTTSNGTGDRIIRVAARQP
jgi:glucose/arabinose dehydrogenase